MTSSQAGFSLLEMTIALSIMGILSTFALPLITEYRHQRALGVTKDHQDRVVKSLESYLIQHRCLPQPEAVATDDVEAGSTTGLRPHSTSEIHSHDLIGIVPYYKLGLPEAMAKDGYGHFMTYIVAADACAFGTHTQEYQMGIDDYALPTFCGKYSSDKDNFIEIWDEKSKRVLEQNNPGMDVILSEAYGLPNTSSIFKNYIVFALVSHGADGVHKAGSPEEEINNQAKFKQHKIVLKTQPYSINPHRLFRHRLIWGTQQEFAEFCKAEKIAFASKNLKKTVNELEKLTQAIKHTADTMDKIKAPRPQDNANMPSLPTQNPQPTRQQPAQLGTLNNRSGLRINEGLSHEEPSNDIF